MARPLESGEPAKFNYQEVQFFPFGAPPGNSYVLCADPWSYLRATLTQKASKCRGDNRTRLARAQFYADLAESFYEASKSAPIPTRATLLYYGMLNLAKSLVSVRGVDLETTIEHHGMTVPVGTLKEVKVLPNGGAGHINLFHEFARVLGTPVTQQQTLTFGEICSHVPELHEICATLGHLSTTKRQFLPMSINLLVNAKRDNLFTEVRYYKKHEARVATNKFYSGVRKTYFKPATTRDGVTTHRSDKRKAVSKDNWPRIYKNVVQDYEGFAIATILTPQGYKYYCDLSKKTFHHLAYSLLAMFYVGNIARYRPTDTREIMASDLHPVVTEMIACCPGQFLYQVVSHTTKTVCVVPHSKLG